MDQLSGQIASAVTGLGAGLQGQPNPIPGQQQQALRTQLQMSQIRMRLADMKRRDEETSLGIGRDLLRSDSPEGRQMGARVFETALKQRGMPVGPGFVKSFADESLDLDRRKQAYIAIMTGASDEYLANSLRVPPAMVPQLKNEAQSPAIYKLLYGKTPQQEERETLKSELDQRRFDVMERRQDLNEAKEARQGIEGAERLRQGEARLDLAERRLQLSEAIAQWRMASGPAEKRTAALNQADLLTNQLESTARALAASAYLPESGAGVLSASYIEAQSKRRLYPNDTNWQFWTLHLQPAMIGYARSVQNDIGPRAIAAFQGAMKLMNNPPDLQSVLKITENMRIAIRLGRAGKDTAGSVLIRHPNGTVGRVPWSPDLRYDEGDQIIGVE